MKNSDYYITQALQNITEDREKLKKLYDDILELGDTDPLAMQAVSENLVKVVDSLTKQTGQVVELAKLKQKSEGVVRPKEGFGSQENTDLYDEIETRITKLPS